jgi:hypothetical protein
LLASDVCLILLLMLWQPFGGEVWDVEGTNRSPERSGSLEVDPTPMMLLRACVEGLSMVTCIDVVDEPTPIVIDGSRAAGRARGFGFEGGRLLLSGGQLHLFTAEVLGEPAWSHTELAHWASADGDAWLRDTTLFVSTGDMSGQDPFAALFSPMPVFNTRRDVWELFFVAYRSAPNTAEAFLLNHAGRVLHGRSMQEGAAGLGGPYRVLETALQPDADQQEWEGLQGVDSFFPFQAGPEGPWFALYGSASTQFWGRRDEDDRMRWRVGLAHAPSLDGPWKRRESGNPLEAESRFIENPVVQTLPDGQLVALYDNGWQSEGGPRSFGSMTSADGATWTRLDPVTLPPRAAPWARTIRTPLGLVEHGDGTRRIYFTGFEAHEAGEGVGHVGYVTVTLR